MRRRCARPCLACGVLTTNETYCTRCARTQGKTRSARPHYDAAWDEESRAARAAHVAAFGPVCPGYKRPAHVVNPAALTTDHIRPRDGSAVQVLCRSCNARKGNDEKAGRPPG